MSNRVTHILKYLCGALLSVYMVLMVSTVIFAAVETKLSSVIHKTRTDIGMIETKYYDEISRVNAIDPGAMGYVKPKQVVYVTAVHTAGLSLVSQ